MEINMLTYRYAWMAAIDIPHINERDSILHIVMCGQTVVIEVYQTTEHFTGTVPFMEQFGQYPVSVKIVYFDKPVFCLLGIKDNQYGIFVNQILPCEQEFGIDLNGNGINGYRLVLDVSRKCF